MNKIYLRLTLEIHAMEYWVIFCMFLKDSMGHSKIILFHISEYLKFMCLCKFYSGKISTVTSDIYHINNNFFIERPREIDY